MDQALGVAAQIGIFFIFTPFALLAKYGGKALDLRRADAERRAVMLEYGINLVAWTAVGEVQFDDSGQPSLPTMPAVPGLRRLEFVGPYPGLRSVSITASSDLHRLNTDQRPGRRFADDDMAGHLKAGGTINASYIDRIDSELGPYDLADELNRRRALDFMRQEAEIEAARAA